MLRILRKKAIGMAAKFGHRLSHFEAIGYHASKTSCAYCGLGVTVSAKSVVPIKGEPVFRQCKGKQAVDV